MTKYLPAACLWIACLSLASGAGCAQRPASSESVTKPAATASEKPAGEAGKAEAFIGRWSYDRKESCASNYTATLSIDDVTGQTARGEWTSYNSEDGREGNVIGELRSNKLLLRFCHATGARQGEQACPNFGSAKVYVRKHGEGLAWHRLEDDAEIPPGKGTPLEYACGQEKYAPTAQPTPPPAEITRGSKDLTQPFVGEWAYAQGCGRKHSATLRIQPESERKIAGTWDDGTIASGSDSALIGEVRDSRLYLRFCRNTQEQGRDSCPAFAAEDSYLVREGNRLVWHRKYGKTEFVEYLRLHYVTQGQPPPLDNKCTE
jgi:hypothetical protein